MEQITIFPSSSLVRAHSPGPYIKTYLDHLHQHHIAKSTMSRGDRTTVTGNLSSSMRDNYGEYGIAEYYKKVGSTYRNPHYPGVRLCIFAWLSKWWSKEASEIASREDTNNVLLFDMACGKISTLPNPPPVFQHRRSYNFNPGYTYQSGEVTVAFHEWLDACKRTYGTSSQDRDLNAISQVTLTKKHQSFIIPLGPDFPTPLVIAADPFTSVAYKDRTSLPCAPLSFSDIAEGELPPFVSDLSKLQNPKPASPLNDRNQNQEHKDNDQWQNVPKVLSRQEPYSSIEMVICSFALHLLENPSALFTLLCTLSYKARWLVVLAPHKKPEIKDGWGWKKWNVGEWRASSMSGHEGEILFERVHCRVYRSTNI